MVFFTGYLFRVYCLEKVYLKLMVFMHNHILRKNEEKKIIEYVCTQKLMHTISKLHTYK